MSLCNNIAMTQLSRYDEELRDKAHVRAENDHSLLARLDTIQQGEALDVLAPFAKAYLGLFLDMDNSIAPEQRIDVLANTTLARAIQQGIQAVLLRTDHPDAGIIAKSLLDEAPLDRGYIVLAGIQHLMVSSPEQLLQLPDATLSAALCFHYTNKTNCPDEWIHIILQQRQKQSVDILTAFWLYLIDHGSEYLPGVEAILNSPQHRHLASQLVLPLLQHWTQCRKKILRGLLLTALLCADQKALRDLADHALHTWNPNEPGRYALWLATAYLVAPELYLAQLSDYLGRSRERMLPLLDYIVLALMQDTEQRYPLSATALIGLLQSIAPKFTPQVDRHGNLCDNSLRVMYLFYRLAICRDPHAATAMTRLGQIRVMKLYSAILDYVALVAHERLTPTFEAFVSALQAGGRIKAKCNWSDLR